MGTYVVEPAVFRRGVVHGSHGRKQDLGQSVRRNGRRDERHDIDDGQLALRERVRRRPRPKERVYDSDEHGKEKDYADGREVAAQVRSLDDHVGVGVRDPQDQRAGHADSHGARGDHLPWHGDVASFPGCFWTGDRHG